MTDEDFMSLRLFAESQRFFWRKPPLDSVPVKVVPGLVRPELDQEAREVRLSPADFSDVQRRCDELSMFAESSS